MAAPRGSGGAGTSVAPRGSGARTTPSVGRAPEPREAPVAKHRGRRASAAGKLRGRIARSVSTTTVARPRLSAAGSARAPSPSCQRVSAAARQRGSAAARQRVSGVPGAGSGGGTGALTPPSGGSSKFGICAPSPMCCSMYCADSRMELCG